MRVTFEGFGSLHMSSFGTAPAKTPHFAPSLDEEDLLDWDCYLDKLPPPTAQGTIKVELSPIENSNPNM